MLVSTSLVMRTIQLRVCVMDRAYEMERPPLPAVTPGRRGGKGREGGRDGGRERCKYRKKEEYKFGGV